MGLEFKTKAIGRGVNAQLHLLFGMRSFRYFAKWQNWASVSQCADTLGGPGQRWIVPQDRSSIETLSRLLEGSNKKREETIKEARKGFGSDKKKSMYTPELYLEYRESTVGQQGGLDLLGESGGGKEMKYMYAKQTERGMNSMTN